MTKHKSKNCPNCKRLRPVFVIKKGKCDICRVEKKRESLALFAVAPTWADIKAKCKKELQRTDWAMGPDIVEDKELTKAEQKKIRLYRRAIRDIKNGTEKNPALIIWPEKP